MANKTGNSKDNDLKGTGEGDFIQGLGGNDTIHGGDGNDVIHGGAGNDLLFGDTGTNTIYGDAGNDQIVVWKGHDTIDGGDGSDLLDFFNVTKAIKIDLATDNHISFQIGKVTSFATFKNIEGLYGSHYSDVITGDKGDNNLYSQEGNDTVHGGDGNDVINGYKGDDKLFGDDGDDLFVAAPGTDIIDGGKGNDWLDFGFSKFGVTADLEKGSVTFTQVAGKGTMKYTSIESLRGSDHNDNFTGDNGVNFMNGKAGDDKLIGLDGNDFIEGGDGNDVMTGGAGKDTFLFDVKPDDKTNFDKITDFQSGIDHLAFEKTVFDVKGAGKTEHLDNTYLQQMRPSEFQSGEGHDAKNADIRIIYDASDGILYHDSNGSKSGGLSEIADIGKHLDISADQIYVVWYQ